ncbi:MAG: two-component regulator propeller domain-containing protein [Saprospiraceae bacterium]|nr:two-component regulator propeller domain-containing protein [Saprospiraceae bacterium]
MKDFCIYKPLSLLVIFLFITSCYGQGDPPKDRISASKTTHAEPLKIYGPVPDPFMDGQISQYVRRIFQDKNGNLWLGTNGDGVCRYNPVKNDLTYFTTTEGFGGHAVRGIAEDGSGNLWFATDGGVSRYDGSRTNHPCNNNTCKHDVSTVKGYDEHNQEIIKSFTNYTTKHGLGSNQVWSILLDKNVPAGEVRIWCGTEGGVSCFDGITFTSFPIPAADLKDFPYAYPAPKLQNCIFQDKDGDIWFGSNGNGAYRFDGTTLTNISEKDGLCNNFVYCVIEDKTGNLWFGSRFGGLSRYDPAKSKFTNFTTKDGLSTDFIWTMREDKTAPSGETWIWISANAGGLCRYDPVKGEAPDFAVKEGLNTKHIQSIFEDKNGKLWLGCSGGLFRYDPAKGKFINVTRLGPWE